MASVRERIARDIVQTLEGATDPVRPRFVSRNPIGSFDISIEQYPCIFVRTGQEERSDATMDSSTTRFAFLDFTITGFVRAGADQILDEERNQLIQAIEDTLEDDRKRNNLALNSLITNVTTDEGDQFPIGRVDINYRVHYKYTRGTT